MTERIYFKDSYTSEVKANLINKEFKDGFYKIIPDKTVYYPESGGQLSDRGFINGKKIIKVEPEGDNLVHFLEEDIDSKELGIRIDFKVRYDHMQQHTAQHLLSAAFIELYDAETLSFSMGDEYSSIEVNMNSISRGKIKKVEKYCSNIIFENRDVKIFETEDIDKLNLRKPPPDKKKLRIVKINGLDQSACGGTHLKTTGEIGLIKIIKTDKVRSNIRVYFVAGYRALDDYLKKDFIIEDLQKIISRPMEEFEQALSEMKEENKNLKKKLAKYKKEEMKQEAEILAQSKKDFIVKEFKDVDIKDMNIFVTQLVEKDKNVVAYMTSPKKYIIIARGKGDAELSKLSKEIFSYVNGRGGGRPNLIQGKAEDFSKIDKLIDFLKEKM